MSRIKVMVVDDHTLVRESLMTALATSAALEVVGGAGSGREALDVNGRLILYTFWPDKIVHVTVVQESPPSGFSRPPLILQTI